MLLNVGVGSPLQFPLVIVLAVGSAVCVVSAGVAVVASNICWIVVVGSRRSIASYMAAKGSAAAGGAVLP